MTQQELDQIEQALNCVLPQWFKEFMLQYPEELRTTTSSLEDDEGNLISECPADTEFSDSAKVIIGLNKDDPDNYQYSLRFENWPDSHLIIGCTQTGDAYAIDMESDDPAVFFAEPASGYFDPEVDGLDSYFEQVADSLEEFAAQLIDQYKSKE